MLDDTHFVMATASAVISTSEGSKVVTIPAGV